MVGRIRSLEWEQRLERQGVGELGVGDPGVPKRMKKLAGMYYGRLESYAGALDRNDREALEAALKRNIHPEEGETAPSMLTLADWMFDAEQALATLDENEIETGMARIAVPGAWSVWQTDARWPDDVHPYRPADWRLKAPARLVKEMEKHNGSGN